MWYRAVVLEAGGNDLRVIYADYGNTEKVPFSRILPIPMHLLQLPFQITRCTLACKKKWLSLIFSVLTLNADRLCECSGLFSEPKLFLF